MAFHGPIALSPRTLSKIKKQLQMRIVLLKTIHMIRSNGARIG